MNVSYARISEDQNGEGAGVARQHEDTAKLADAKGLTIERSYTDNDISALDESKVRPEFERLIVDVAAGKVNTILVWHMDRLAVRVDDLARLLKAGKTHGVTIAAVHGISIDMSDPTGVAVATILVAIAEMERRHKGMRQRRANRQRAEAGLPVAGGQRPFGYGKDRLTVKPDEAEAIQQAAEKILSGGSVSAVVREWNTRGVTTVRGGKWKQGTLSAVLRSPRIAGLYEYQGEIIGDAQWPAILDRDVWERLQHKLSNGGHGDGKQQQHLLSGLLQCAVCDAPMGAGGQKGSYRCDRQRGGCGKVSKRFDGIDSYVIKEFRRYVAQNVDTLMVSEDDSDTAQLQAERDDTLARIDDLRVNYGTGKIKGEDFFPTMEILRNRQDELEAEIDRIEQSKIATRSTLGGVDLITLVTTPGDDTPPEPSTTTELRERLRRFIVKIEVSPHRKRGSNRFDPETVKITWR